MATLSYIMLLDSFVRGIKPGRNTGFDIDDYDLLEMETCQGVVVASAIFGIDLLKFTHSLISLLS